MTTFSFSLQMTGYVLEYGIELGWLLNTKLLFEFRFGWNIIFIEDLVVAFRNGGDGKYQPLLIGEVLPLKAYSGVDLKIL